MLDSLENYSMNNSRLIKIESMEIQLPSATLTFGAGELYFTGHFRDRPTAAFFVGSGEFVYRPPNETESQQVRRFYKSDSIHVAFDQVYMAFPWNSRVFDPLDTAGQAENPSYKIKVSFNLSRSLPDRMFKYNLPFHLYKEGMEGQTDFIWVDVIKVMYNHTVYVYDPYEREQVSVFKHASNFKRPQVVSAAGDSLYRRGREFTPEFDLFRYDIDVDISTYSKSSIICRMLLNVGSDSTRYASFVLPPEYRIDSVRGDVTQFIKDKDRPELMVEFSEYFHAGDTIEVEVFYRTNLFRHYMNYGVVHENLIFWYPGPGRRQLSEYHMRYAIDRDYDFISVGDMVSDTVIEGRRVLEYQSPRPIAYVSFNYGLFDSVTVENSGIPITVYSLSKLHGSPIFGRRDPGEVTDDIAGSFAFYSDNIAPYPFRRLDVAAMSVGFGQGSPGVVHMSESTFGRGEKGVDDKFRAHEVAHQWWGHLVSPATYRDVWLSEGLAEYSAMMYIQAEKKQNDVFRQVLKDWKKKITRSGKLRGEKSEGFRAGAIILGQRLRSELSPGDYEAIIYCKAAYLLHMLRFELEEVQNKPREFVRLLSHFARKYSGRPVTTEDFVGVASQYLGDRAGQFFDQWLYGWRVPKIKSKAHKKDDGSAEISIDVSEIGEDFVTPYPVMIIMTDNSIDLQYYYLKRGKNSFSYRPAGGLKVKSVSFNPDYDILER
ncbi:MAG: hypothetical protein JSU69_07960 [Candidatus Zixiibacteriota bacterium]|nr:MAG: hypothetical protein JSU69_07960 [candidate division Zixibacteria bacterium]